MMSEDDPLRALDDLGRVLDRAVRADAARRTRPRAPWRRTGLAAILVALLGAGIAVGAVLVFRTGDPLTPPSVQDVGPESRPVAGSGQLTGRPAADPHGGPAWDVRVSRTVAGQVCTAVGQVYDGGFGIVGLDHVFRALPLGASDACGSRPAGADVQAGARTALGRGAFVATTIVAGVAGPAVSAVQVGPAGGRLRPVGIGAGRGFVAAFAGYPEGVRPVVRVLATGQATRVIRLADTRQAFATDPGGGAPWVAQAGAAEARPTAAGLRYLRAHPRRRGPLPAGLTVRTAGRCVQAREEQGSSRQRVAGAFAGFGPFTPSICGDVTRHPVAVAVRRFDPQPNGDWGLHPARTILWGVVRGDVTRVELVGSGVARRRLAVGPDRVVLAVLDGHVDPRSVTLRIRLHDGRLVVQRGATALHGERGGPIAASTPPPYRSVASARRVSNDSLAVPLRGTIRSGAAIRDPRGGAPWVLRTFLGRPAAGVRLGRRRPSRLACYGVGRLVAGTLRRPAAGRAGNPLGFGDRDALCNEDIAQPHVPAQLIAYSADATDYAPGVDELVVSGLAPTARSVVLIGARGGPRRLPLVGHGGFLAVLSPADARGPLRVRVALADGAVHVSAPLSTGAGHASRPDARAPDPDGAAPWAVVTGAAPRRCVHVGQLVGGALAYVDPDDGSVRFGSGVASSCGDVLRSRSVSIGIQAVEADSATVTTGQVQRRTLSGRTVLYGVARPGITSLTVRTPRDVRRIVPTGPGHAFVVVYDGALTGGELVLTPHGHGAGRPQRLPLDL